MSGLVSALFYEWAGSASAHGGVTVRAVFGLGGGGEGGTVSGRRGSYSKALSLEAPGAVL